MRDIRDIPSDVGEYLAYNEEEGVLTWIKSPSRKIKVGSKAGSKYTKGYLGLGFKGRKYLLHRVIWFIYYGEQPPLVLDHMDGDRTNNRIANLREASVSDNTCNKTCKGYSFNRKASKWEAYVNKDRRRTRLGYFSSEAEASAAYHETAKKLHGEFYCE